MDTLSVSAIEYGTVIDHIPPGLGLKIVHLLKLADHKQKVTLGLNLSSKSLVFKDLIKVEGRILTNEEVEQIAVFAPNAVINVIENFKVIKKVSVQLPKMVRRVFSCPNQRCITNHERVGTEFKVAMTGKTVTLCCHYCERCFSHEGC